MSVASPASSGNGGRPQRPDGGYQTITKKLAEVNVELRGTLHRLDQFVATVDAIGRLLVFVDELIKVGRALAL